MPAAPHPTRARHHRSLLHPRRGVCPVPIDYVSRSVAVPVRAPAQEPARQQPEWLTDAWKHRVEAEALHHLEHHLRGVGAAH